MPHRNKGTGNIHFIYKHDIPDQVEGQKRALVWQIHMRSCYCTRRNTYVAVRALKCVRAIVLHTPFIYALLYVIDDHVALYFGDHSLLTRRALLCIRCIVTCPLRAYIGPFFLVESYIQDKEGGGLLQACIQGVQ